MARNMHPLNVHSLGEALQLLEVLFVDHLLVGACPPAVLLPARNPASDAIDGEHAVRVENQLADVLSLRQLEGFAGRMNFCSLVCLPSRKSNSYI